METGELFLCYQVSPNMLEFPQIRDGMVLANKPLRRFTVLGIEFLVIHPPKFTRSGCAPQCLGPCGGEQWAD